MFSNRSRFSRLICLLLVLFQSLPIIFYSTEIVSSKLFNKVLRFLIFLLLFQSVQISFRTFQNFPGLSISFYGSYFTRSIDSYSFHRLQSSLWHFKIVPMHKIYRKIWRLSFFFVLKHFFTCFIRFVTRLLLHWLLGAFLFIPIYLLIFFFFFFFCSLLVSVSFY